MRFTIHHSPFINRLTNHLKSGIQGNVKFTEYKLSLKYQAHHAPNSQIGL